MLDLHCCTQAFSSCGEQGLLSLSGRRLLTAVASLESWASRVWALGAQAFVVVAQAPSCSMTCGIFSDEGLNPCLLHWQVTSYPLCHQGSPGGVKFLSSQDVAKDYSNFHCG